MLSWADSGDELRLEIRWGADGVLFLPRTSPGVDRLMGSVRAVLAGDVDVVHALGRSRTIVGRAPGRAVLPTVRSGVLGRVPLPFWPRWGRRAGYAPYRAAETPCPPTPGR